MNKDIASAVSNLTSKQNSSLIESILEERACTLRKLTARVSAHKHDRNMKRIRTLSLKFLRNFECEEECRTRRVIFTGCLSSSE